MARITFSPVVYSQFKRRDDTYVVKMRITLNGKSKYLTTSEVAYPSQLTRSLKIKDPGLLQRLRDLESRMREAVSGLDMYELEKMDVDEAVAHMNATLLGEGFRLDFLAFWPKAVSSKPEGSRQNYMIALHSFQKFLGVNTLDISKVTSKLMQAYEAWLTKKYGKGARAVSAYTAAVKHVHSLARKEHNDEEFGVIVIRNPFAFYVPPKSNPPKHRDVDAEVIQQMIDMRLQLSGVERRAVDAFLLSFALMGMNAPDLLSCAPPKNNVIVYFRQKTRERRADRAEMHVLIDERIRPLFEEWKDFGDKFAFKFHRFNSNFRQFNGALSYGLNKYCKRMGINKDSLDFYSARHTWATLARNKAGVDKYTVNDCLCHVDSEMRVTDIYIHKDWSMMWEANKKVLDLFQWHF